MSGIINSVAPLLAVEGLYAGYGKRRVLEDVTFTMYPGEIVAVIGPNGCGKSTLLKAVFGLCQVYAGSLEFAAQELRQMPPHQRPGMGIAFLPQGKHVFEELSVRENLLLGGYTMQRKRVEERIEAVLQDYSLLRPMLTRAAYTLSGGERQQLALARAMIPEPKLLLLDEPSVGLSPKFAAKALEEVKAISERSGAGIVLVEQRTEKALAIADRAIGMRLGRVACHGAPEEVREQARGLFLI